MVPCRVSLVVDREISSPRAIGGHAVHLLILLQLRHSFAVIRCANLMQANAEESFIDMLSRSSRLAQQIRGNDDFDLGLRAPKVGA